LQLTANYSVTPANWKDGQDVVISPIKDEDIQRNSKRLSKNKVLFEDDAAT
jgi:alkyl hydroperoxide reductase subunit AhpC